MSTQLHWANSLQSSPLSVVRSQLLFVSSVARSNFCFHLTQREQRTTDDGQRTAFKLYLLRSIITLGSAIVLQITFLGTSSGVPTKMRNVSAVALKLPQRAEVWLFDCGEATQHQIQHTDLRISQLRRIFITHLHGDHLYGLMGLLATCGMAGHAQPIDIYGPAGLDEYVRISAQLSRLRLAEHIQVRTVQPGMIYEDEEFTVSCQPLRHRVPAFGYRVTEKDRPGRFNVERATELN